MRSPSQARDLPHATFPRQSFDYRWQAYPGESFCHLPGDGFRGGCLEG